MKRYIKSNDVLDFDNILIDQIVSIVLVDDIDAYNPRDRHIFASTRNVDYSTLTRDQLLQLPKRELEQIHDVRILRKLHKDELTVQQQRDVIQDNQKNFTSTLAAVKEALNKLKQCHKIFVWDTEKNNTFIDHIYELGGEVTDRDASNIVKQLHVKDYAYSTYSYLDVNWSNLLMVFEYTDSYTFDPIDTDGHPITVDKLDIYIKIDIENETRRGYAAMSFHAPEFKLNHPYKDYPVDKE